MVTTSSQALSLFDRDRSLRYREEQPLDPSGVALGKADSVFGPQIPTCCRACVLRVSFSVVTEPPFHPFRIPAIAKARNRCATCIGNSCDGRLDRDRAQRRVTLGVRRDRAFYDRLL